MKLYPRIRHDYVKAGYQGTYSGRSSQMAPPLGPPPSRAKEKTELHPRISHVYVKRSHWGRTLAAYGKWRRH